MLLKEVTYCTICLDTEFMSDIRIGLLLANPQAYCKNCDLSQPIKQTTKKKLKRLRIEKFFIGDKVNNDG